MNVLDKFDDVKLNLEILAEEASEIIQAKSKIIRFGIDDYHPKNGLPNREKLEEEIGHLLKIVDILIHHGTLTESGIQKGRDSKIHRLEKWYKKLNISENT